MSDKFDQAYCVQSPRSHCSQSIDNKPCPFWSNGECIPFTRYLSGKLYLV